MCNFFGSYCTAGLRITFGSMFDESTFLHSPAFVSLAVVTVESSARLLAQGTVSLAAGEGNKDLAAVSGNELAIEPWSFRVLPTTIVELGRVPCSSDGERGTQRLVSAHGCERPIAPLEGQPASLRLVMGKIGGIERRVVGHGRDYQVDPPWA